MRPGQNKRMRGRPNNNNNNNRRGPNPLTRSYESNGPDVKIRGNAHHVAEKYLQLARDAHTGGDPVAAENYLQHAEHYFRLIAAAQAAQLAAQGRAPGEPEPEDADDEDEGGVLDRFASPPERVPAYTPQPPVYTPQPNASGGAPNDRQQPFEGERQGGGDRGGFVPRGDRHQQGRPDNRGEGRQDFRPDNRQPRNNYGDRGDGQNRNGSDNRPPREFRPYRDPNAERSPPPPPPVEAPTLPSFITAAPRTPLPSEVLDAPQPVVEAHDAPTEATEGQAAGPQEAGAEPRFPRGPRRRRLRSPYGFHAGGDEAAPVAHAPGDENVSE